MININLTELAELEGSGKFLKLCKTGALANRALIVSESYKGEPIEWIIKHDDNGSEVLFPSIELKTSNSLFTDTRLRDVIQTRHGSRNYNQNCFFLYGSGTWEHLLFRYDGLLMYGIVRR